MRGLITGKYGFVLSADMRIIHLVLFTNEYVLFTVRGKTIFLLDNKTIHLSATGLWPEHPRTKDEAGTLPPLSSTGTLTVRRSAYAHHVPKTVLPSCRLTRKWLPVPGRPTLQANAPHSQELSPHRGLTHRDAQGKSAPQAGH